MNDSSVKPVENQKKLIDSSAYVLFYSKTSVEVFRRQTITNPEAWPHLRDDYESLPPCSSRNLDNKETLNPQDQSLVVVETPLNGRKRDDPKISRPPRMKISTQINGS